MLWDVPNSCLSSGKMEDRHECVSQRKSSHTHGAFSRTILEWKQCLCHVWRWRAVRGMYTINITKVDKPARPCRVSKKTKRKTKNCGTSPLKLHVGGPDDDPRGRQRKTDWFDTPHDVIVADCTPERALGPATGSPPAGTEAPWR